jgi:integrase
MAAKRRRLNGEGTIQTVRRNGAEIGYRGAIRIETKLIVGPLTKKRSDALPRLYAKLRNLAKFRDRPKPDEAQNLSTSMDDLITHHLVHEWRPKTVELASAVQKKVDASWFGKLIPSEIQPSDILRWRIELGIAASSAHRYQCLVERVLTILGHSVRAAKPSVREPSIRVLTRAEQRDIINRAPSHRSKLALKILLEWGLRAGEACGLRHDDRHEDGVWLRRQAIETQGRLVIDNTMKTDESRAWLPMIDPFMLENIGPPRTGYVIGTAGTPMRPSNLRRMVQSVAAQTPYAGITPHELRHTAGVNLLRAGVDPATAASITRHSIKTLLKIYHRVTQEGKIEALNKLQKWRDQA